MRSSKEIGADLRRFMRRRGITELELAQSVSSDGDRETVSQSWVSRICKGEFKRATPRVARVARYAKVRMYKKTTDSEAGKKLIGDAVERSWNGTMSHASMLARIILAARPPGGRDDAD
jgi:transcriptional regulator with XRE-family HTH domain